MSIEELNYIDEHIEKIRQKQLNIAPERKKKITPKLVNLYIDSEAYNMIYNAIYDDLSGKKLGGLKRSCQVRNHKFFDELKRIFGEDDYDIMQFLYYNYEKETNEKFKSEFIKKYGYKP